MKQTVTNPDLTLAPRLRGPNHLPFPPAEASALVVATSSGKSRKAGRLARALNPHDIYLYLFIGDTPPKKEDQNNFVYLPPPPPKTKRKTTEKRTSWYTKCGFPLLAFLKKPAQRHVEAKEADPGAASARDGEKPVPGAADGCFLFFPPDGRWGRLT